MLQSSYYCQVKGCSWEGHFLTLWEVTTEHRQVGCCASASGPVQSCTGERGVWGTWKLFLLPLVNLVP